VGHAGTNVIDSRIAFVISSVRYIIYSLYHLFVLAYIEIKGDQKVSMHLMITVQKHQKYFKQFQSLTMIT
jgi:uncharacterized membrane protein YesL